MKPKIVVRAAKPAVKPPKKHVTPKTAKAPAKGSVKPAAKLTKAAPALKKKAPGTPLSKKSVKPVAPTAKAPAPRQALPPAKKPAVAKAPVPRPPPAVQKPTVKTVPVQRAPKVPAKVPARIPSKPTASKPQVQQNSVVRPKKQVGRMKLDPMKLRGEKRRYYDALIDLRNEIVGQVRNLSASSLASNKQAGEELADVGSDNFTRELGLAMMTEDGKKIALIQEALDRLGLGTYGVCVDCSKLIGEGRLKAIPYAKLCIDCKGRREIQERESPYDYTYGNAANDDSGSDAADKPEGGDEAGDEDEDELVE